MSPKKPNRVATAGANAALVPKLRFPEFRDGWDTNALGEIATFVNEKVPLERVAVENYVSTENILPDYGGVAKASKLPATGSVTRYRPNDTLVSNIRPYLKKVWVADKEGGASNDVIVIRAKQSLLPEYFSCLLKNDAFIDYVMTGAKGVKMPRGDVGAMKAYPMLYPSIAEQQKIADCLSSLDELIAAQGRKVEALKTHKKGLMQQLFPREGETQPRLRFPEFKNSEEWRELPLAALAEKIMVGIASAATHAYRETGVPMLRNQNIKEGGIDDSSLLFIDPAYEVAHKNKRLRAGDVITVRTGYPGLSAVITQRHHNAQCFTSLITRPKKDVLSPDYLCAYINSDIGKRFIIGAEAGGAQKNVNAGALEAMPVHLPALDEQKRIASFMSSLDVLIAAAVQELDAIKTHKQGLMQQLFPSPEAVAA